MESATEGFRDTGVILELLKVMWDYYGVLSDITPQSSRKGGNQLGHELETQ